MVLIIWRQTQKIKSDKWDELEKVEKKFLEAEKQLGFPTETKKRYRGLFGSEGVNTLIIDYQWVSMAKMEKIYTKAILDPDYQKLMEEALPLIEESRWEILVSWPAFPEQ
ncbi:MAG: hypothetical protein KGD73_09130 [Candidatus Lokiarchaeota archaeon]|nr:hypothetical protein [Candidatus Lokiarchaeota archaeon]